MHTARRIFVAASVAMLLLAARAAVAVPAPSEEKERDKVLRRLDEAAKNFRSTSADFEFDSIETEPVYDKDVQKGTVYYERKGGSFQMAAHIVEHNGKPASKIYGIFGGVFKLFEGGNQNQVTTFSNASKYEGYLILGFGASGKELEQKWDIKWVGSETLDGVKTEKLELVARDPAVRKNLPKVTVWMDVERGVSLKQRFDEGPEQYRDCFYFNFKFPQALPADAFTFKTDANTQYVNR